MPERRRASAWVQSPLDAQQTLRRLSQAVEPVGNVYALMRPPDRKGRAMRGFARGGHWYVWCPGHGLVKVWLEEESGKVRVYAEEVPAMSAEGLGALMSRGLTMLVVLALAFLAGAGLLALQFANRTAAAFVVVGAVVVVAGLVKSIGWTGGKNGVDRTLGTLGGTLTPRTTPEHSIGDTVLERHRLEVMHRLKGRRSYKTVEAGEEE